MLFSRSSTSCQPSRWTGEDLAGTTCSPPGSTPGDRHLFACRAALRRRLLPHRVAQRQPAARPRRGVHLLWGKRGVTDGAQRELTRDLTVSDVMCTKPRTETVTPYHTFGQVLDSVIHGYQEDFPVLDDGNLVGMLTRNEIMSAAHSPERYSSVRDLMKTNVPTISSQADLFEDALRILQQSGFRALPVTENGELVGMLTIEDVGQASLLGPLPRKTDATAMTVEKARPY